MGKRMSKKRKKSKKRSSKAKRRPPLCVWDKLTYWAILLLCFAAFVGIIWGTLWLQHNIAFEVPGFGIFRQTGGGEISFEVSEEFDFAPDSFSLEAISLELNPEPVEEQKEPETEEEEVQEGAEVEEQQSAGPANDAKKQKTLMWILVAAIVVLLIALFIALFKEQFAQMIRNLLYTEEELEIIRQWGAR